MKSAELEQVDHTHGSFGAVNANPHFRGVPVLAPYHSLPLRSEYLLARRQREVETFLICDDPTFKIGAALRSFLIFFTPLWLISSVA